MPLTPARAATLAGTAISNTASVAVATSTGIAATRTSNTVATVVGELLDVTLTPQTKVVVRGGDTGRALAFTLTNRGDGQERFNLSSQLGPSGAFAPIIRSIVVDSDGDGRLTSADAVYQAGADGPLLAPGGSTTVWVVCDMPASVAAGGEAPVQLTATAATGSGAPGTSFPGKGDGGGDAVVGKTGASASAQSAYVASGLAVSVAKSQTASVAHPTSGSTITYTLQASFTGAGTAAGAALADPIPPGSTYVPGSLRLDGASLTDAQDGDPGRVDSSGILVALGDVAAPAQHTVTFQVRVNASTGSSQ